MKVLDHEVLVLVLNIWSWSWFRSWRKSLAVFQDFCCNSWRQWARHTMAFCERQRKPQLRRYLIITMGAIF